MDHPWIIGIVGAGNMGSGIAQAYALHGHFVVLVDANQDAIQRAQERIQSSFREAVERKLFEGSAVKNVLERIQCTTSLMEIQNCHLIIEAIFEDKTQKIHLLEQIENHCSKDALIASNTSSFLINDLARALRYPNRFFGLHYFYHPAKNKLVEVVTCKQTDAPAYQRLFGLQEQIGKIPIASKDAPGFIVNRFFVPWLNEAVRMLADQTASIPTIEQVAKETFQIGIGPFELMNLTGLPIAMHALTELETQLGPFYSPSPLLTQKVQQKTLWDLSGPTDSSKEPLVRKRFEDVVFSLAKQLVKENVCTKEDCDLGARLGLRWKQGPFELMGQPPCFIHTALEEGILWITFNRPDSLNALSPSVLDQLSNVIDLALADPNVQGMVFKGRGKAFMAGADVGFFMKHMQKGQIEPILSFTKKGQDLFNQIDDSPKPIVACVDGMALGGGLELALCCDAIFATPRSIFGFPETGIGLYPGLGGTQRTPKKIGLSAARYMVLTGTFLKAEQALGFGLIECMIDSNALQTQAKEWIVSQIGKPSNKAHPDQQLTDFLKHQEEIHSIFTKPLDTLLSLSKENTIPTVHALKYKAPLALRLADHLLTLSTHTPLKQGLEAEQAHLSAIFTSHDAHVGLQAIGKPAPQFIGK